MGRPRHVPADFLECDTVRERRTSSDIYLRNVGKHRHTRSSRIGVEAELRKNEKGNVNSQVIHFRVIYLHHLIKWKRISVCCIHIPSGCAPLPTHLGKDLELVVEDLGYSNRSA